MRTVPPPDPAAHHDFRLLHDMTDLNTELSHYVVRFLDADAGRAEPPTVTYELALADKVAAVAATLRDRAERRHDSGPALRICSAQPE
ncbi:hypothetical protein BLA60_26535 [Actinophytocola xinjiangensis]|uniref:Uncharacterized protein n=1 Tax=Actinophytocola xinjiangensis TaxID=485602 RepID=A0A7Z0WHN8_9PSEU|nr:hypothetical protein [Actinophytocola xinjiangensis]OLF07491.1 hypothetical protein BLA60_26535 [Actinophytocola xinjiangensis]